MYQQCWEKLEEGLLNRQKLGVKEVNLYDLISLMAHIVNYARNEVIGYQLELREREDA